MFLKIFTFTNTFMIKISTCLLVKTLTFTISVRDVRYEVRESPLAEFWQTSIT